MIAPVHRLMSLRDPTSKMSKSDKSERSRILITDEPEQIEKKIASAMTDSLPGISYDPVNRPGVSNLLDIFSIFDTQGRSADRLGQEYGDSKPKHLKELVADAVIRGLDGIRDRYLDLINGSDSYLDNVEAEGARKARKSADETMQIVRSAIGL